MNVVNALVEAKTAGGDEGNPSDFAYTVRTVLSGSEVTIESVKHREPTRAYLVLPLPVGTECQLLIEGPQGDRRVSIIAPAHEIATEDCNA